MDNAQDHLIVDGYNIINAWPELSRLKNSSFEDARSKLIEILINYQGFKKNKITLVFDAHQVKGGIERREKFHLVEVVYTKETETADMFIEKLVGNQKGSGHTFVATSDWIEQSMILQRGAYRISARELQQEIITTFKTNMNKACEDKNGFGYLHYKLPSDIKEKLERWRRGKD